MKHTLVLSILIIALVAGIFSPAAAKPSMQDVLRATFAVNALNDVDLSPDGQTVVWSETFRSAQALSDPRPRTALFLQPVALSARSRITAGKPGQYADEEEPVWSPDGKRIAFLSDARKKEQLQLFLADAHGNHVRQISHLNGNIQGLRWSPDGKRIAFLYVASAHRKAGALAPGARDVGVVGSSIDEQRLTTIEIASGSLKQLTPEDVYVYEYGWSPDSRKLAVTYAHGNGDNNWWIAKLATVNAAGGALHDLLSPQYQIDDPQWSPDGKFIALIEGIMSDFGSTGGDVYLVDPESGVQRNVTPGIAASAASLRWVDAAHLDMLAHVQGSIHLMKLGVYDGSLSTLISKEESISSWSPVQGGKNVAIARTSFDAAPELWAGPPEALKQITHSNPRAVRLWGPAKSVSWQNDGFNVQGWLIYPLGFDPNKRYPMVTIVHGGPSAESLPGFGSRNVSALSSQGYFVFEPNPRGSFGQGEKFTQANVKDFAYGDWRDDLSGVDAALKAAPIDPQRLGLFGWSYGGYMAMWAETQTTRFKSIVAGAGVVNWQSYYGQNKIDQWMVPFFGASVYDDPAVYAKSSPITFIKQSKTPVLILQGELDEEVPAAQALEFWHAMRTLEVPTELMIYAGEGHGPRKPANQIDIMTRMTAWFDRYLR
ncbi:MAG: S9 family peptidase [Candidatus Eremiobacteraeota bacterium]|nr:S9 family peptidase [Candidatus Eremiobacteraeota bacterium]